MGAYRDSLISTIDKHLGQLEEGKGASGETEIF